MPCYSHRDCGYSVGPFVNLDGNWRKIDPIKTVDVRIGNPRNPEDYGPEFERIAVRVDGLETYEQVKDLIGYVHSLWEKK